MSDLADSDTIVRAERRMQESALKLARMAPELAQARQVKEYDGERRKRALAVLVIEQLDNGIKSVTECEHRARASAAWGKELNDLSVQLQSSLRVVAEYDATVIQYEAARSILSTEKEKMKL